MASQTQELLRLCSFFQEATTDIGRDALRDQIASVASSFRGRMKARRRINPPPRKADAGPVASSPIASSPVASRVTRSAAVRAAAQIAVLATVPATPSPADTPLPQVSSGMFVSSAASSVSRGFPPVADFSPAPPVASCGAFPGVCSSVPWDQFLLVLGDVSASLQALVGFPSFSFYDFGLTLLSPTGCRCRRRSTAWGGWRCRGVWGGGPGSQRTPGRPT